MFSYIQVISRSFEQPHPAATLKKFREPLSLQNFITGYGGYSQSFWKTFIHDVLPHDASWSMIAHCLYNQNVRFYELPSKDSAPVTHNGKGTGYVFFQGPESLPSEALDGMTMLDSEKAQTIMATVKADASYWKRCLNHAGIVEGYSPLDDGLQDKIKSYLASGKLRAYSFSYKPKMSATGESSSTVENHVHKPVPLAPESPSKPTAQPQTSTPGQTPVNNTPKKDDVTVLDPGEKGNWNAELNGKLKPEHKYQVGPYLYETDDQGRINRVSGTLDLEKRDRNTYQQTKAGKEDGIKDGLADDEGGHIIASIFNGPGEQINYAAMDGNLNKGAWKRMENSWAEALKKDPPEVVIVDIDIIYEGDSKRPEAFEVFYEVDGKEKFRTFENVAGG
ncbi:DNA/RNA non-specific endonuclease [Agarilytica rhodophyticola]|uniref:DNA/RNA non-specific endonuclease n=1 Tax=Agarilytica rhodophyticola TaxID=1737490 RepID=UPI001C1FE15B|nr:DNA/RNA non-specific endonuclease [Agarilytica rhodophyticola]